jgi:hypothetical protein
MEYIDKVIFKTHPHLIGKIFIEKHILITGEVEEWVNFPSKFRDEIYMIIKFCGFISYHEFYTHNADNSRTGTFVLTN